jgi:predicted aconitase with swiveling domain
MTKLSTTLLLCLSTLYLGACTGEASTDHDDDGHDHGAEENHDDDGGADHHDGDDTDEHHDGDDDAMAFVLPTSGKVFFLEPADGATVSSPVMIKFGVEGVGVNPAGTLKAETGHHHILINQDAIAEGTVVPADEHNIHFGGGQTETELELKPGVYTLTMQLADGMHRSYGAKFAASVKITVE